MAQEAQIPAGVVEELVIRLMANGQVTASGPLGNKVKCYGLLEVARDIIRDFKAEAPGIVPANGAIIPPFPGRM